MNYLLDTNACVALLRGRPTAVTRRLLVGLPDDIALCAVVKAELLYGARHSADPARSLARLARFFAPYISLPFDDTAAEIEGRVRADLAARGTLISANDLHIASIALANDLTLMTQHPRGRPRGRAAPGRLGNDAMIDTMPETTRMLPEGWRWARLGEICEFTYGSGLPASVRQQGEVPVYGSNGVVGYHSTALTIGPTIVIGRKGSIGEVHFSAEPCWPIDTTYYIDKPQRGVDLDWLIYLLRSLRLSDLNKAAAIPGLNRDDAYALEVLLPPRSEQRRIAALLAEQMAAVERARAAAEARLAAARALPATLMRQIFEGEEAQGWPRKSLAQVCRDISDGTHFTPTYLSQGVPFLSVKDVRQTGISFTNCRFISEEQHRELCRRCKPERGDVLYTKVGTTGIAKTIDIDREFSIFVSVALLKLKANVIPEYIEIVLNSPLGRAQAEALTQGMANRNLVIQDIKRIEIPVPPLDEQQQITGTVNRQLAIAERSHTAIQAQLDAINALPAALLRRAFAGEV